MSESQFSPEDFLRAFMLRELRDSVWMHALRGSLTGAWGWIELMDLRQQDVPEGLRSSVQAIKNSLENRPAQEIWPVLPTKLCSLEQSLGGQALSQLLEVSAGLAFYLDAALGWAAPEGLKLSSDRDLLTLSISGLDQEACLQLQSLSADTLRSILQAPRRHKMKGVLMLHSICGGFSVKLSVYEEGSIDLFIER